MNAGMRQPTLDELAKKYGSDKGSAPYGGQKAKHYCGYYEELFTPCRCRELNLLEVGVAQGASLKMWKEWFPHATIWGVDIERYCKQYEDERVRVWIGDQTSSEFWIDFVQGTSPMDIIIDDGAHTTESHMVTFKGLWGHLNPGGLYVIEDLVSNFEQRFNHRRETPTTKQFSRMATAMMREKLPREMEWIQFIRPTSVGGMLVVKKRSV